MKGFCNSSPPSGKVLILASTNQNKFFEIRTALGHTGVPLYSLGDFPEVPAPAETAETFAGNAQLKAEYYWGHFHKPVLAEDSGLVIPSLAGFPGVHSARIAPDDATRIQIVLERLSGLADRSAYYICSMAFLTENGAWSVEGRCDGTISDKPDGELGFGYDPIFRPDHIVKTFGRMSIKEKSQYSHRARAIQLMLPHLLEEFRRT